MENQLLTRKPLFDEKDRECYDKVNEALRGMSRGAVLKLAHILIDQAFLDTQGKIPLTAYKLMKASVELGEAIKYLEVDPDSVSEFAANKAVELGVLWIKLENTLERGAIEEKFKRMLKVSHYPRFNSKALDFNKQFLIEEKKDK